MKNKYIAELKLPFEIDLAPARKVIAEYKNLGQYNIFSYEQSWLDRTLAEFFHSRGCFITYQEMFYTPPFGKLPIHVDQEQFSNMAKINWILGAQGSEMVWWNPKDPTQTNTHTTPTGTKYMLFSEDMVDEEYRFPVRTSTFINAGIPHSVDNHTNEGRWCLSHCVSMYGHAESIQMDQVHEIFKDCIKP